MFERATDDIIALAAAAAAAVVAVVAAAFAIYALCTQMGASPALAATIVAAIAAIVVAAFALFASLRARAKQRAAQAAQADIASQLPFHLGDIAREHPFVALAATLVTGAVAARHPKMARDLITLIARFSGSRH